MMYWCMAVTESTFDAGADTSATNQVPRRYTPTSRSAEVRVMSYYHNCVRACWRMVRWRPGSVAGILRRVKDVSWVGYRVLKDNFWLAHCAQP
ncbi:hypothetical protein FIBSPDRAFT_879068, partial [Athelia psychrophila]